MNEEIEFSEALTTIRHYSNLRFAELSLFSAATGGLAALAVSYASKGPIPLFVVILGCILTVVFIGLELCVRTHINSFRTYVVERWPDSHYASTPKWSRIAPRYLFMVMYSTVLVFWILLPLLPRPQ